MSDGKENAVPHIKDVMNQVNENDIVVTSISFGQSASKVLEDLARVTGGSSYFASTNGSLTLMNAFTTIINKLVGPSSIKVTTPIQVSLDKLKYDSSCYSNWKILSYNLKYQL